MKKLLLLLIIILVSCSNIINKDGLYLSIPQSNAKHISNLANEGYVIVLDEDKIYSLNNFINDSYHYLINGEVYIANIPAGEYIIGVVLLNNNIMYGFSLEEITITPGYNQAIIDVGPGIQNFIVDNISINNPFEVPSGIKIQYSQDTIIVDYDKSETPEIVFSASFGDGYEGNMSVIGINGGIDDLGGTYRLYANTQGIQFNYSSGHVCRILLK